MWWSVMKVLEWKYKYGMFTHHSKTNETVCRVRHSTASASQCVKSLRACSLRTSTIRPHP
jgi:hypothetical protein